MYVVLYMIPTPLSFVYVPMAKLCFSYDQAMDLYDAVPVARLYYLGTLLLSKG